MFNKRGWSSCENHSRFFRGSQKRGISAIVATVLIILITVAAIGVLWLAVIPMIQTAVDFSNLQGRVMILNKGYTAYDSVEEIAMVQVKRDVDEGVMNRIKITFDVEGNSHSSSVVAPESGGTKVYTFDVSGIGEPDSVSVAPIFASGNREKEGAVTSEVDIPSSAISEVGAIIYEVGRDYTSEMPITGLVSWWKFDGDAKDSVGSNDGTVSGAIFIEDNTREEVIKFDGVDDWSEAPLIKPDSITVSVWFYLYGWVDQVDGGSSHHIYPNADGFGIVTNSVNWGAWIRAPDGRKAFYSNHHHTLNEWHHIVLSYDEVSGYQYLYVDGEQVQSLDIGSGTAIDWRTSSTLRFSHIGWNTYGLMDDVMIYDKALSEEEVATVYDSQKKV